MTHEPRGSGALPSAWTVLAWGTIAAPLITCIHAAQVSLQNRLQGSDESYWFAWTHLLPIWLTLAIGAALVVPFVRTFPLPGPRLPLAVAAHLAAGLVFPLVTLALLDAMHAAMGTSVVEHYWWLLGWAYFEQLPVFFAVAGALHLTRNARERARLRSETLELRAALADARLAALTQQLRPHFLFNALNSAAMLVREGEPDQAVDVLARLSGLIREMLRDHPHDAVPLSNELTFLREYLAVEGVRFGERLTVDVACDPLASSATVPFLVLQPIVENALRYGVACRAGRSRLAIDARRDNGRIRLVVEERGDGGRAGTPEPGEGLGIANTRERLRASYGAAASFTLDVDPSGNGSRAELIVPAGA